jgi:hypothetical protein
VKHVSEFDDEEPEELQSTWERFDHVVDDIFQNPPSPEAHIEVSFTYEGYRITVRQDGNATFVPVD